MTTREEALTVGWPLASAPTFFGPQDPETGLTEALAVFRSCPMSPWAVTQMSGPPRMEFHDEEGTLLGTHALEIDRPVSYKRMASLDRFPYAERLAGFPKEVVPS